MTWIVQTNEKKNYCFWNKNEQFYWTNDTFENERNTFFLNWKKKNLDVHKHNEKQVSHL